MTPPKSHWGKSWHCLKFSMLILGHEWWSYRRQGVVENCESTGRNGHHLPSAWICKCFFPNHYELPENLCQSWNWMLLCFLPVRTPYTSNLEGTVFCGNPGVHEFLLPSLRWHFRHGEWDLRVCPGVQERDDLSGLIDVCCQGTRQVLWEVVIYIRTWNVLESHVYCHIKKQDP